VVAPGRCRITLLYTCPEADLGSTIQVAVGEAVTEATLTVAHDPDPLPSPDRVPRKEVYEKIWAPLEFPAVEVAAGDVDLVVRATQIPGAQAMDLKAVIVRPA
jgi:arylsulfatase A